MTLPELRAQLVRLKADLHQVQAELVATTHGTKEYGQLAARHQTLSQDYEATQKRLRGLQQGSQPSLL